MSLVRLHRIPLPAAGLRHLDRPRSSIDEGYGPMSAFQLDQPEIALDALDDRVEQLGKDPIGSWDPVSEVDPVLVLDAGHEPV